ncbi:MAG: gliding motility-associated ABC transporter substrate-binding protein GldG [Prevotella sp.]|jgi:ABC-2 type transport system permease protein|nr:gliding motility-associated ABC transporter substrate-binding protein GldG [Prevotella sp.]
MKALVLRELKSVFCSPPGIFFALAFLSITGAMLWAFSGSYNFIDGGYADMSPFFDLAPALFAILIPALTMRLFSGEKRSKTLDILMARPVKASAIYFSKFLSAFVFILAALLPTAVYACSLYQLANPAGNMDTESLAASYISLVSIAAVFTAIGLFGSVVTKNQMVAFIVSATLCLFSFYGFDLLAGFFLSGKTQVAVSSIGLLEHYKPAQRGVMEPGDLQVAANYLVISAMLAVSCLSRNKMRTLIHLTATIFVFNTVFFLVPNFRFDFTADKRHTLSDFSKKILEQAEDGRSLEVCIYLTGDLNYGFQRLKDGVADLLSDFNRHAGGNIRINYIDPYGSGESPDKTFGYFAEKGMTGIMLNETDREGKVSRKMIYPYAQVTNGGDTLVVSLLKNMTGNTADENLNASIESLEFEFIDAIRLLGQERSKTVAFIEGHNELPEAFVRDAEELLSKYYSVNRGEIGNNMGILDDFAAIIIAGPLSKYTETEKYIIDQYIMKGGKVLWLVDGVCYSHKDLALTGQSPGMKNDVNLDDLLFAYGARINPDLIQDRQCVSTYLITDEKTQTGTLLPCFYQPLLIPFQSHPVTKNIREVKAGFASSIDVVNSLPGVKKDILLTSSANAHLVQVPGIIDFDVERIQNIPDYFNQPFVPVAVSLEGAFVSAFTNRLIPDGVQGGYKTVSQSKNTKMIVVSSSDIITNEGPGHGSYPQVQAMGYDRVSRRQFGNRDFFVNAVNWLTDEDGLMALRSKKRQFYILNKKEAFENRNKYMALNTGLPVLFMALLTGGIFIYRKRKYEK